MCIKTNCSEKICESKIVSDKKKPETTVKWVENLDKKIHLQDVCHKRCTRAAAGCSGRIVTNGFRPPDNSPFRWHLTHGAYSAQYKKFSYIVAFLFLSGKKKGPPKWRTLD